MAEIEQLSIGIEAEAPKAAKTIDSLVGKLDILVKSLSAVSTTPVKINIDTSKFDKIGKSLKLDGLDKTAKVIGETTAQITDKIEEFRKKYEDIGKSFEASDSLKKAQSQLLRFNDLFQKAKLDKESFEASGDLNAKGYERAVENFYKYGNTIENIKQKITELNHTPIKFDFSQMSEVELDKALGFPNIHTWNNQVSEASETLLQETKETAREFTGIWSGIALPDLGSSIKEFGNKLSQLEIPPIKEENLDKLSASLEKAERSLDELRANLANGITMGRITESVDDKGYVKLQEQIALTEKTAAALRDRIKEVGKEAKNASGIKEVGKAANSASDSFSDLAKSGTKASNSLKKMQDSLKGVLKAMLPILGIRELFRFGKESIKSSMDYLEVLNYFDAAFGQVAANADLSSFEEMGYSSAEAYYSSFAQRAEELTQKMSGFTIGEGGLLESTGTVSLGLDPSQLMNYQAMFGQMSSSMGVSSETSMKLSQALTEIGADLASIKNLEFETVWNDMASGLAGMSRTLDKYGVNIRNVNLQQKLMELGIDANIQSLNQNDKALLRAIILLENTKYAWGDLADTINQPANQLRMIEANFQNLARTIGNLFLPLVKTVLPYVNALVIAVQRLFSWLGNLMGIDISGISTSIGGADMGDILDQTDDLASGLGGAKEEADKLNKSLRQFDELKVISTKQDDSGAGSGGGIQGGLLDSAFEDAFSKYQQVWDEAFGNLENRAQEIADKIEKAFEPVKKIIQDFAIGDFFQAGKDVSALVVSITDFFADAIDKVDWYGIGKKIGDFLAGVDWLAILKSVGNLIWQALKAAFELYVGAFSAAPLETALISLVAFPKLLKAITASKFITGIGKLWKNFKIWGEKIKLVTETLTGNKDSVSDLVTTYPKLSKKVDGVKSAFSNFFSSVKTNGFWKTVNGGITNIRNNLGGLQKAAIVAVAGFAEFSVVSDSVEKLTLGTENWLAEIGKIAGVVAVAAAAMYTALGPAGLVIAGITGVVAAIKGINDAFDTIRAQEIGESIKNAMSNPGGVALSEITSQFADSLSEAASGFDVIKEKSSEMDGVQKNIESTWTEIYKIQEAMDNGVISVDEGKQELERLFGELATLTEQKFSTMNTVIMSAYGEGGSFRTALSNLGLDTEAAIDTMITYGYQNSERAKEIAQELAGMDINTKEYKDLITELQSLTGEMSSFEKATSDFTYDMNSLQGRIDYSEIFLEDGSINTEALQRYLDEATTALSGYETSLDEAGKEISEYWQDIYNSATATDEQKAVAKANLDYIPQAIESMKSDAKLQIVGFTDTMQNEFLTKTSQIIDDSVSEWESKNAFEKWWNGIWGAGTKGEYVKEAVDQQQENIAEVSLAIEQSLGNLGVDGVGWANDAAKEIYSALFDAEYIHREVGLGHYKYTLNEDYKEVISGATDGISELSRETGKGFGDDTVEGFGEGVENNSSSESAVKSWMERVYGAIHDSVMNYGSPSKTAKEFGLYTVEGFNLGISNNASSSETAVSSWMSNITSVFSEWISKTKENFGIWGKDTLQGFAVWSSDTVQKFSEWGTQSKEKISRFNQESKGILSSWNTETSSKIENWKNINFGKINTWSENTKGTIGNWKANTQNTFENWKNDTSGSVGRWSADIEGKFTQWKTNTENTTSSWYRNMQSYFTESKWNFGGVSQGLGKAFSSAFESVKGIWNSFASSLNQKLTWTIDPIVTAGKKIFEGTTINLGNIPKFAKGGITLSHTFAEIGEYNRPEAILPLTNDRAMGMIAESIYENYNGNADYPKDGYFDNGRMSELISETRRQNRLMEQQNQLLERILGKPTMEIGDVNNALVKYSMERGGNYRGGNMSRLAVAEEVYR